MVKRIPRGKCNYYIPTWKEKQEQIDRCGKCKFYEGDPERSGECLSHGHFAMGWSAICSLYKRRDSNGK